MICAKKFSLSIYPIFKSQKWKMKIENLKMRTLSVKIKGFQKFLANFRDYGAQNLVDMRLRCARMALFQFRSPQSV